MYLRILLWKKIHKNEPLWPTSNRINAKAESSQVGTLFGTQFPPLGIFTVTRKFPVNSNGWHGEVDVQLSLFGLLLLTQPLNSSEQHTRADLEFSSDFGLSYENIVWW